MTTEALPPKTCSIDRMITVEADIEKVLSGQKKQLPAATDGTPTRVKLWSCAGIDMRSHASTSNRSAN